MSGAVTLRARATIGCKIVGDQTLPNEQLLRLLECEVRFGQHQVGLHQLVDRNSFAVVPDQVEHFLEGRLEPISVFLGDDVHELVIQIVQVVQKLAREVVLTLCPYPNNHQFKVSKRVGWAPGPLPGSPGIDSGEGRNHLCSLELHKLASPSP